MFPKISTKVYTCSMRTNLPGGMRIYFFQIYDTLCQYHCLVYTRVRFYRWTSTKKGDMLWKIQPGIGLFTNLSILHRLSSSMETNKQNIIKNKKIKCFRTTRSHKLFDLFPLFLAFKSSASCSSQNVPLCRSFNWFVIQFLVYVFFLYWEAQKGLLT